MNSVDGFFWFVFLLNIALAFVNLSVLLFGHGGAFSLLMFALNAGIATWMFNKWRQTR